MWRVYLPCHSRFLPLLTHRGVNALCLPLLSHLGQKTTSQFLWKLLTPVTLLKGEPEHRVIKEERPRDSGGVPSRVTEGTRALAENSGVSRGQFRSNSKVSAYSAGDLGLTPRSGRSSGEGNGNPLQYSCLENPMDRAA